MDIEQMINWLEHSSHFIRKQNILIYLQNLHF